MLLTADEHDADGEDLLRVGVWRDVAEANAGQAAEGEIQSGDVLVLDAGSGEGVTVVIAFADLVSKVVKPANPQGSSISRARALYVADGVPDAGQPVGNEREGAHEQEQDGCAVFRVSVQLPRHAYQTQQPCGLQQANQSGGLGLGEEFQVGL